MMLSAPLAAFVALAALALHGCGQGGGNPPPTPTPAVGLQSEPFVKYPTYDGNLTVSGFVWIGEVDVDVQVVFASLIGVDPSCTGPQTGAGNVCGMHIHSGTTCSEATGGHYFASGMDDPWVPVTYTDPSGAANNVEVSDTVLITGFSLAGLQGKVFVVHDSTGARVACSVLKPVGGTAMFKVPSFVKYPGSGTSFDVEGEVEVQVLANEITQILRFQMTGVDTSCKPDATISAANGCGIHIHTGTSCEDAIGGHYFDETVPVDPWKYITYRVANSFSKGVTIPITTGLSNDAVSGRVVVVHDKGGARIACGVMGSVMATQDSSVSALNDEAPGTSPLVWVSAILVIASLGGGAWYYRSQSRGYSTQQDASTEMQDAAAQRDDSTEVKNAAAQQDASIEMHNAA